MNAAAEEVGDAHIVDARGSSCPRPIIEIARVASKMNSGARLALISDDPATAIDLPAWCKMKGHKFLGRTNESFYLVELN
ncbi:MAG: sulfurtransferase TusA family protein [Actinobacteria bacterium]|nr:sulfurtransferase TusA family protein [Actinomycetota bacterium]